MFLCVNLFISSFFYNGQLLYVISESTQLIFTYKGGTASTNTFLFYCYSLGGDTAMPRGLHARLCHAYLVISAVCTTAIIIDVGLSCVRHSSCATCRHTCREVF